MRIIAGNAGGRRLKAPAGTQTRPTSDRVREALFSILGAPPADSQILDLFAGSGALGLEALSRGAGHAHFVEQNNATLQTLRANIKSLGLEPQCQVIKGEAIRQLRKWQQAQSSFHWIFIDPPYATALASESLNLIGACELLATGGQLIVEHDRRGVPADGYGCLVKVDSRRYGDTHVSLYERNPT